MARTRHFNKVVSRKRKKNNEAKNAPLSKKRKSIPAKSQKIAQRVFEALTKIHDHDQNIPDPQKKILGRNKDYYVFIGKEVKQLVLEKDSIQGNVDGDELFKRKIRRTDAKGLIHIGNLKEDEVRFYKISLAMLKELGITKELSCPPKDVSAYENYKKTRVLEQCAAKTQEKMEAVTKNIADIEEMIRQYHFTPFKSKCNIKSFNGRCGLFRAILGMDDLRSDKEGKSASTTYLFKHPKYPWALLIYGAPENRLHIRLETIRKNATKGKRNKNPFTLDIERKLLLKNLLFIDRTVSAAHRKSFARINLHTLVVNQEGKKYFTTAFLNELDSVPTWPEEHLELIPKVDKFYSEQYRDYLILEELKSSIEKEGRYSVETGSYFLKQPVVTELAKKFRNLDPVGRIKEYTTSIEAIYLNNVRTLLRTVSHKKRREHAEKNKRLKRTAPKARRIKRNDVTSNHQVGANINAERFNKVCQRKEYQLGAVSNLIPRIKLNIFDDFPRILVQYKNAIIKPIPATPSVIQHLEKELNRSEGINEAPSEMEIEIAPLLIADKQNEKFPDDDLDSLREYDLSVEVDVKEWQEKTGRELKFSPFDARSKLRLIKVNLLNYPQLKDACKPWGVQLRKPCKAGDILFEYVGEVVKKDRRTNNPNYQYDMELDSDGTCLVGKGAARMINHSPVPNVQLVRNGLKVYIVAKINMDPGIGGINLLVNYNCTREFFENDKQDLLDVDNKIKGQIFLNPYSYCGNESFDSIHKKNIYHSFEDPGFSEFFYGDEDYHLRGTPLTLAIKNGANEEEIRSILHDTELYLPVIRVDGNLNTAPKQLQNSVLPLHAASYYGNINAIKVLIQIYNAIDINVQQTGNGRSPLHTVILSKSPVKIAILELLLNYGADILLQDADDLTPFHLCAENNLIEETEILLDYYSHHYGRDGMNANLLQLINYIDRNGSDFLNTALQHQNWDLVVLFLRKLRIQKLDKNCNENEIQYKALSFLPEHEEKIKTAIKNIKDPALLINIMNFYSDLVDEKFNALVKAEFLPQIDLKNENHIVELEKIIDAMNSGADSIDELPSQSLQGKVVKSKEDQDIEELEEIIFKMNNLEDVKEYEVIHQSERKPKRKAECIYVDELEDILDQMNNTGDVKEYKIPPNFENKQTPYEEKIEDKTNERSENQHTAHRPPIQTFFEVSEKPLKETKISRLKDEKLNSHRFRMFRPFRKRMSDEKGKYKHKQFTDLSRTKISK